MKEELERAWIETHKALFLEKKKTSH